TALGRFGLLAALGISLFLRIHVVQEPTLAGALSLGLAYLVLAAPFFFAGLCITIVFTHFSSAIGRLYAADLVGASLGCLCTVILLSLASAPIAPPVVGWVATTAALLLSTRAGVSKRAPIIRVVVAVGFLV